MNMSDDDDFVGNDLAAEKQRRRALQPSARRAGQQTRSILVCDVLESSHVRPSLDNSTVASAVGTFLVRRNRRPFLLILAYADVCWRMLTYADT
jgi:hypothetical protein